MRIHWIALACVLGALALGPGATPASAKDEIRIAVVDGRRALISSNEGRAAEKSNYDFHGKDPRRLRSEEFGKLRFESSLGPVPKISLESTGTWWVVNIVLGYLVEVPRCGGSHGHATAQDKHLWRLI